MLWQSGKIWWSAVCWAKCKKKILAWINRNLHKKGKSIYPLYGRERKMLWNAEAWIRKDWLSGIFIVIFTSKWKKRINGFLLAGQIAIGEFKRKRNETGSKYGLAFKSNYQDLVSHRHLQAQRNEYIRQLNLRMAEDSRYRQPLRNPDNRGNCPGCGYSSFGKVWRQFCCREPECRENRNVPCFFSVWKFSEDTVFPWPGLGKHLHNTIKGRSGRCAEQCEAIVSG